jgi:hypothetical protein
VFMFSFRVIRFPLCPSFHCIVDVVARDKISIAALMVL